MYGLFATEAVPTVQAQFGSTLTIEADGEDEQAALDAVLAVIADKFGEGE